MLNIYFKELISFFSSLIGYVVIAIFLLFLGLIIWVFPDYSILYYYYATLDQLFEISPMVFLFLIPAITMRSFSEEKQSGTLELLQTKPLTSWDIVLGKYFASLTLVIFALIPTVLYYYTVHNLGSPPGNIDAGAVLGSYIGLILLAAAFTAIGVLASALSSNQIVSFLLAAFICFILFWGFLFLSKLPGVVGTWDVFIQWLGLDYHYQRISQGLIDTRNVIYLLSVTVLFLLIATNKLETEKS
ncbi:MAG: gliding motility-associated ABC transporter permease subunit GldF [Saprospiraceae bacterium]|nr:gliding motility-associated ABC transporter permease subunit GldF [Saprospiraceae bacterium]